MNCFVYATTVMLEFWRPLLRQSKPSTLTVGDLSPYFILPHPDFIEDGDIEGDAEFEGGASCKVDKGDGLL